MATQTGSYDFKAAKEAHDSSVSVANDMVTSTAAALDDKVSDLDSYVRGESYVLTTDTEVNTDKTYYTRSGSGTEQNPYVYTEVASPSAGSLSTYYESVASPESIAGQMAAGQAELGDAIDELAGRTETLEDSVGSLLDDVAGLATDSAALILSLNGANYREQTVYRSAALGTATMSEVTTWVSDATGGQNKWTTVRPPYTRGYPVFFTAIQRQTVEQAVTEGSPCSCTPPVMDNTWVSIEGANIIANSITAEHIDLGSLRAALLQAESLVLGDSSGMHMEAVGNMLLFLPSNVTSDDDDYLSKAVAYIAVNQDTDESVFYMTRSVVVEDMYFGDGLWKFYRRSNRNMSLKWMGGE